MPPMPPNIVSPSRISPSNSKPIKNEPQKQRSPNVSVNVDALIESAMTPKSPAKKPKPGIMKTGFEEEDEHYLVGGSQLENIARQRAKAKEKMVDDLLGEYQANPNIKTKTSGSVSFKKEGFYPLYGLRKILGLAHVDLHVAVLEGKVRVVKSVIKRLSKQRKESKKKATFRINAHDDKGRTALSLAVKSSREDVAEVIIKDEECDASIPDKHTGLRPIHHAAHLGLVNTIMNLVEKKVDVDSTDSNGTTALMMACSIGNVKIVDALLSADADPTLKDSYNWNALFYAAYGGSSRVVTRILAEGVSKRKKDKKGRCASDWAEFCGNFECLSVLDGWREDDGRVNRGML